MVIGPIDYSVRFTRLVGQKYASCATNVLVLLKKGRTPLGAWLGPAIGGGKMQGIDIYSKVWRQASTDSVENTPPTWSLDDSIPSQRWGPKFFSPKLPWWFDLICIAGPSPPMWDLVSRRNCGLTGGTEKRKCQIDSIDSLRYAPRLQIEQDLERHEGCRVLSEVSTDLFCGQTS